MECAIYGMVLPGVVVDGVCWLQEREYAGGRVQRAHKGEQEAVGGASIFASFEATAPTDVRVPTKHPTSCSLETRG